MFKNKPILKQESAVPLVDKNLIVPAKSLIPEWYKKIPKWKDNEMFDIPTGFKHTLKQCVPFLDAMTTGYLVKLPYDLYVKQVDGEPYLSWMPDLRTPPSIRKNIADINLIPYKHANCEYAWKLNVAFTVPPGYSMLLTHPLNRHDLPFTTISGVIDGGFVTQSDGNLPFYIKGDFEGIIKQGTPVVQIIPFLQQNWNSEIQEGLVQRGYDNRHEHRISGWYKELFWKQKKYQ